MPVLVIFMQDSDTEDTSKLAKHWFYKEHIPVLAWAAQSSNLNSFKKPCNEVKCTMAPQQHKNLDDLWIGIRDAWYSILKELCPVNAPQCLVTETENIKYHFYSRIFNLCYFIVQRLICFRS